MSTDINMDEWSKGFVVGTWGELDGEPVDRAVVREFIAPTWSSEQVQGFDAGCALHERGVDAPATDKPEPPCADHAGCWRRAANGPTTFLFVAALIRRARRADEDRAFDDEIIGKIATSIESASREERRLWPSA